MGNLGRFFSLKYHDELSYSTTKHKFKEVSEDSKNSRNQEITLLSTNYNFEYLTFCRRAFSSHWLTFKVYFLVFHFLSFIYSSSRIIYFFVQDPKPLEVYSADFVIDGPQLGFLGNVSSSFPFSLFFLIFFRLYTLKIISKDMSQIKLIRGQLFNHLHLAIFPLQVSFIKDFHFNSWPNGADRKIPRLILGCIMEGNDLS